MARNGARDLASASEAGGRRRRRHRASHRLARNPIFTALLEAMVPAGGPFEAGAAGSPVAREVEAFVGTAGPRVLRALRLGLWGFDLAPFVLPPWRGRRFSRLPLDERVRILEAWEGSRLVLRRQAVHVLKLLVMAHFYSQPAIEARLGYPHPLDRVPRAPEATS